VACEESDANREKKPHCAGLKPLGGKAPDPYYGAFVAFDEDLGRNVRLQTLQGGSCEASEVFGGRLRQGR